MEDNRERNSRVERLERKLLERLTPLVEELDHEVIASGGNRTEWVMAKEKGFITLLGMSQRESFSDHVIRHRHRELSLREQETVYRITVGLLHLTMVESLVFAEGILGLQSQQQSET